MHAVAFAPGRPLVSFGGVDKNIYLFDLEAKMEDVLSAPNSQPYWITCLGFSPDGAKLAAGDESCDIWLYDLARKERVFHNKHHVECWLGGVAWAPDNETFLFACRPNAHAGKPAIWQALARVEVARSEEVRDSRMKLIAECDRQLAYVRDEKVRESIRRYRDQLGQEEIVQTPGQALAYGWPSDNQLLENSVPLALPQNTVTAAVSDQPPADATPPAEVTGSTAGGDESEAQAPQQVELTQQAPLEQFCQTPADGLSHLPNDLRRLAQAHRDLVQKTAALLNKNYFCVNQWRVASDAKKAASGTSAATQDTPAQP